MTRSALRAGAVLLCLGPLLTKRARALLALVLLSGAGCASQTERCLTAADAHREANAHRLCHGVTWRACQNREIVNEAYRTEQELCRPEGAE